MTAAFRLLLGIVIAIKWTNRRLSGDNPMSKIGNDPDLTTDEAIVNLKISKPTFLKYIRLGKIRAIKAGKGWRILQSELNRFLNGEQDLGESFSP